MNNLFINLSASFVTFLITALINFWMTPFIISNLGAEAYGFIPLTQNLVSVLTVLTIALSSVIARFFTVAITRGGHIEAEVYFNTYLVAAFGGSLVIISIIILLISIINNVIHIPPDLLLDVRLAILFSGIMVVLTLFKSLFLAAPFSQNKIYINKGIEVFNAIIKGSITFFLLVSFVPRIWFVNLGAMIGALVSLIISIYFFRKLIPSVKFKLGQFSFSRLKELLGSGIWVAVGQIGVVLFLGVEILVANITLGATMAGIYAALIQFPLLLRSISNSISSVFAPVIIKKYANNDLDGLKNYSNKSVKVNGLLIVFPAAILCSFAEPLLTLWLGEEFVNYKWVLILSAGYLIFTLTPLPLTHIFTAVNKLKVPGITTILFGIINFTLAFVLSGYTSLGVYGIVIAGAIGLSLKNTIFNPYYSSKITNQPIYVYYRGMVEPLIAAIFIISISFILQRFNEVETWLSLIVIVLLIGFIYVIFAFTILLSKTERKIVTNFMRSLLKK